jgi:cytochrome c oxidase subunit 3
MEQGTEIERQELAGKIALWLLMLTIIILFGSLTLVYVFAPAGPEKFSLPTAFYLNTCLLILSSIWLHRAWIRSARAENAAFLYPVLGMGGLFLIGQGYAWYQLYLAGNGLYSGGRAAYLHLLSGVHALHIVGGLLFLLFVVIRFSQNGRSYLESAVYFWHFLGILWVYLLLTLLLA